MTQTTITSLSAADARQVEWLGDADDAAGFLRVDPTNDTYQLHIDFARLHKRDAEGRRVDEDYYYQFRNFAQVLLTRPSFRGSNEAAEFRALLVKHGLTGLRDDLPVVTIQAEQAAQPAPPLMKVVSINVEWFLTMPGVPRSRAELFATLPIVAQWIDAQQADLVVVQELMDEWYERLRPLVRMPHATPLKYRWAGKHKSRYSDNEHAVFSRTPIVAERYFVSDWTASDWKYCFAGHFLDSLFGYGYVTVKHHGRAMTVGAVHFLANRDDDVDAYWRGFAHPSQQVQPSDDLFFERMAMWTSMWRNRRRYFRTHGYRHGEHPFMVVGDINTMPHHLETDFGMRILGVRDALSDAQDRGVTQYSLPHAGTECVRDNACETYSPCNARVAAQGARGYGPIDVALHNRQVHMAATYIKRDTDAFSDHYGLISFVRPLPAVDRVEELPQDGGICHIRSQELDDMIAYFTKSRRTFTCAQDNPILNVQKRNILGILERIKRQRAEQCSVMRDVE